MPEEASDRYALDESPQSVMPPPLPIHDDRDCEAVHPGYRHEEWWRWIRDRQAPDGVNPIGDRTPLVTIELQLRPWVAWEAEPYWWGHQTLTFRIDGMPVWEAHIPEAGWSSQSARVERRRGFGWVLILTLTHDKARNVLDHLALPDHAGDPKANVVDWRTGHASRWSYWGPDGAEGADEREVQT